MHMVVANIAVTLYAVVLYHWSLSCMYTGVASLLFFLLLL